MEAEKMGSVLKHFPGYGSNADTHTGIAVDERPYETFLNSDFLPFLAGIEAGADSVLTAPETRSSSPVRILRDESRQASLKGLYPTGEGAGYAGGIMSAAIDGIQSAEALIESIR